MNLQSITGLAVIIDDLLWSHFQPLGEISLLLVHNIFVAGGYARGLANLLDLYIPIANTTCVFDGASFPPIPIAEIDGEKEWVLDYNNWERI